MAATDTDGESSAGAHSREPRHAIVFMLDVDDTLLDNDRFETDLGARIEEAFGARGRARYWKIYETLRAEVDYADYLGALQRFRAEAPDAPGLLALSAYLLRYPFAERLYPGSLETIARLRKSGPVVLLSDGDIVFQPHKMCMSGLWDAVDGQALIYLHKEQMIDAIERHFPARHYVMVDDKQRVLAAMKSRLRARLTTVLVRQGHYALDPENERRYARADISLGAVGELAAYDAAALKAAARTQERGARTT